VVTFGPQRVGVLPLSTNTIATLQGAMLGAVADPSGTSYDVWKGFPVRVAGKTGTAESGRAQPHAWYTCYAPASPVSGPAVPARIAVAVVDEFAGYGDVYAAPAARKIVTTYLNP